MHHLRMRTQSSSICVVERSLVSIVLVMPKLLTSLALMQVDTEIVYAYAKTEDMGALEEFMSGQHQANLQSVGDRVFDEGLYEAARAIFAHIPNWGRLASTLVRLHQFQQAVDAARKANSPRTWKEVIVLAAHPIKMSFQITIHPHLADHVLDHLQMKSTMTACPILPIHHAHAPLWPAMLCSVEYEPAMVT